MSVPYVPKDLGIDNIRLFGGVELIEEDGEKFVDYSCINGLTRQIALAISSCDIEIEAKHIHFLRDGIGLSQEEVAGELGYQDRQMVSLWERGKNAVPNAVQKLVKVFVRFKLDSRAEVGNVWSDLSQPAPELFDFEYTSGQWIWKNRPYEKAQPAMDVDSWGTFYKEKTHTHSSQMIYNFESFSTNATLSLGEAEVVGEESYSRRSDTCLL